MITVKGRIAHFTGKDAKLLARHAKRLGLSEQDLFTGIMWEMILRQAREGVFKRAKKDKKSVVA